MLAAIIIIINTNIAIIDGYQQSYYYYCLYSLFSLNCWASNLPGCFALCLADGMRIILIRFFWAVIWVIIAAITHFHGVADSLDVDMMRS